MIAFGIYLLKVSLCLMGFYVLYFASFKNTTFFHFNRAYLLFALVASFTIPVLQVNLFWEHNDFIAAPFPDNQLSELDYIVLSSGKGISSPTNTISYIVILSVIYFSGAFFLFIRFLQFVVRMIKIKNKAVSFRQGDLQIVKTKLLQPFSFLNWIFVPEHDPDPLILTHEKTHVNQLHWVDLILIEVISIVLWFNPVMILYRRAIKLQHEYLADSSTLASGIHIQQYLNCLLAQVQFENSHGPINQFYSKSIKNRIVMITKNKTPMKFLMVYILLIPVVCLMLSAFSGKQVTVTPVNNVVGGIVAEENKPSIAPVEMLKAKISSGYGERMHPTLHKKLMHLGIDIVLPEGEIVISTADGVVIESDNDKYRGNYVVVKHGETYATSYSHLKSTVLKVGDKIQKGQLLGYVGSTGLSIEPHLHYEVLKNGKNVDPKDYLPKGN